MPRYIDRDWPKPPYTDEGARSLSVRRKLDRANWWLRLISFQIAGLTILAVVIVKSLWPAT